MPHLPQREFPAQPLVGVGAVVLREGQVLLVRRAAPPLAGYWSVPGGLIELGEEARAAAAREVREETGLAVEIGELLTVVDRIETGAGRIRYHYVIVDYLARALDPAAAPRAASDAGAARWVRWEDLGALPLTPGLAEVLAQARRRAAG